MHASIHAVNADRETERHRYVLTYTLRGKGKGVHMGENINPFTDNPTHTIIISFPKITKIEGV